MTAQIRFRDAGGTLRTLTRLRARDDAGNLRTIVRARVRDASGILRTVWEALTSSVTPTTLTQSGTTSTITTASTTTVTPSGTAPYTYFWQSDVPDGIVPTAPSAATTAFRRSGMFSGDTYAADFYCDVTDATGFTSRSPVVTVTITRT